MHVASSYRGHPHGEVVGCTDMFKDNEQAVMSRMTQGPVSIAAEVTSPAFSTTRLAYSPCQSSMA